MKLFKIVFDCEFTKENKRKIMTKSLLEELHQMNIKVTGGNVGMQYHLTITLND